MRQPTYRRCEPIYSNALASGRLATDQPTWRLAVPTTQGAVEVAGRRNDSYRPDEQDAWTSLAPLLQLLVVRHRDLERLESPPRPATETEPPPPAPIGLAPRRGAGSFGQVVAASQAMCRVVGLARLSATTDYPVLIPGESGTGKDLLARAVRAHSRRLDGPMVVSTAPDSPLAWKIASCSGMPVVLTPAPPARPRG
jgi:hypothetical protein